MALTEALIAAESLTGEEIEGMLSGMSKERQKTA